VQPTVSADRGRLHLESRYNYENRMAGISVNRVTLSGYVFNPDEDKPRFVFAVAVTF